MSELEIKGTKCTTTSTTSDRFSGHSVSEGYRLSGSENMCDSCGTRINRISRKTCNQCQQYFCSTCIQHCVPKGPYICSKCNVFSTPVMERSQLEQLKVPDLRYYTKTTNIDTPLNASHGELIEIILGRQAKVLAEKAKKALQQVASLPQGATFADIDVSQLEPHTSVYSSTSAGGRLYSETVNDNSTTGETRQASLGHTIDGTKKTSQASLSSLGASGTTTKDQDLHIRKKVRKKVDVTMVTHLHELECEEDINGLSVKQVKTILQRNCINYKGCVEKEELLEKVKTLWRDKEENKKIEDKINETGDVDAETEFLCKVCMDAPVNCVLLECGHMLTCVKCGRQLAECPVCRQYVSRVVHAFKV